MYYCPAKVLASITRITQDTEEVPLACSALFVVTVTCQALHLLLAGLPCGRLDFNSVPVGPRQPRTRNVRDPPRSSMRVSRLERI